MQRIFTNYQVDLNAMPRIQSVQFAPLASAYKKVLWIEALILGVVISGIGAAPLLGGRLFDPEFYLKPIMVISLVLGIGIAVGVGCIKIAGFFRKGYALREHDLVYKTGLIYRKTTIVPFNRIQHVKVFQGILLRKYGLSGLMFYTAGGNQGDLTIPGITTLEAEAIRDYVLKAIQNQPQDQVIHETQTDAQQDF